MAYAILRAGALVLACAALTQLVQIPFLWRVGRPLPPAFFASHFVVVLVAYLSIAALARARCEGRLAAALGWATPVVLALFPTVYGLGGALGCALLVAIAAGGIVAWAELPAGRGVLWVSGPAGSATAATLLALRDASGISATGAIVALSVGLVSVGLSLLAGRLPSKLCSPKPVVCAPLAALCLALAAGIAPLAVRTPLAAPPDAGRDAPPAVLIVLDTVRADHLKGYGHTRDTMPALERFVSETDMLTVSSIANSPSSLSSHASLFTGLYPPSHGAHNPFVDDPHPPQYTYPLREDVPTLASALKNAGYWSVAISANHGALASLYGIWRGFDAVDVDFDAGYRLKALTPWRWNIMPGGLLRALDAFPPFRASEYFAWGVPYRRAEAITEAALHALEQAGDQPFFLFLNYFDAHTPRSPPGAYADAFPGRDPRLGVAMTPAPLRRELLSGSRALSELERSHIGALYDGELAYLDGQLARFLDALRRHPRWRDTLLIITSDHGEALGDHNLLSHSTHLYAESLRVPLFIKPGATTPQGEPGVMQSVDVFATIAEHAGLGLAQQADGSPWGRNRESARAWAYVHRAAAQLFPQRFLRETRSIEDDRWKLIASHPRTEPLELYEIARDTSERENMANARQAPRDRLLEELGPRPPFRAVPGRAENLETEEQLRRLRELGYVE